MAIFSALWPMPSAYVYHLAFDNMYGLPQSNSPLHLTGIMATSFYTSMEDIEKVRLPSTSDLDASRPYHGLYRAVRYTSALIRRTALANSSLLPTARNKSPKLAISCRTTSSDSSTP